MPIDEPTMHSVAGVHSLWFAREALAVDVDRFYANSRHETSAEITITQKVDGQDILVYQGRQNLNSARSRADTANRIQKMFPNAVVLWDQLLEITCYKVLEAHRKGDSRVWIDEEEWPERSRYRVKPFVYTNADTLVFGDAMSGKSWFAMLLAVLVTTGRPLLDIEVEPGRVLYLDYEDNKETFLERINAISAGLNEPIPHIAYRRMRAFFADDVIEIGRIVRDDGIDMLIIDSAAPAVGEAESASTVTEYFGALRAIDRPSLTIAHMNKMARDNPNADTAFGSMFWRSLPRANWRIDAEGAEGASSLLTTYRNVKINGGRKHPGITMRLDFEGDDPADKVTFTRANVADVPEWDERRSMADRIRTLLIAEGILLAHDIAEKLEVKPDSVSRTLRRYRDDLFVAVDASGGRNATRWALKGNDPRE